MYVDADTIIKTAALLSAAGAILACLYKLFKWLENQQTQDDKIKELRKKHEEDIEEIKKEQCVMCYALLATLDGLKQLGANGNVSEAHNMLEKHLNKTAHE